MEDRDEEIDDTCGECGEPLGSSLDPLTAAERACCVNPECDEFDEPLETDIDEEGP